MFLEYVRDMLAFHWRGKQTDFDIFCLDSFMRDPALEDLLI
jgi:hypothetical protein